MDAAIKKQILAVRDTCETNMLDTQRVQYITNREGYYELAYIWKNTGKNMSSLSLQEKTHDVISNTLIKTCFLWRLE